MADARGTMPEGCGKSDLTPRACALRKVQLSLRTRSPGSEDVFQWLLALSVDFAQCKYDNPFFSLWVWPVSECRIVVLGASCLTTPVGRFPDWPDSVNASRHALKPKRRSTDGDVGLAQ